MGKKHLSPEEKRRKKLKKLKRNLTRAILISAAVAAGYVLMNPTVLGNSAREEQVTRVREQLLAVSSSTQDRIAGILGATTSVVEEALKTTKIPKQLTNQEEIVVDEVVKGFADEIKKLPAEQAKKVKRDFCADLIEEKGN